MDNYAHTKRYVYDGPVMENGVTIIRHYKASTLACSEAKARANLIYRFKKENNVFIGTKISFPGQFTITK